MGTNTDKYSGIAAIYLDGAFVKNVDLYSAVGNPQAVMYSATGLQDGNHVLDVVVTGTKNPASTQAWCCVDYFEY